MAKWLADDVEEHYELSLSERVEWLVKQDQLGRDFADAFLEACFPSLTEPQRSLLRADFEAWRVREEARAGKVLKAPGSTLLVVVEFVFSTKTARLLRQPLLDLQLEYCDALGAQRPRKAAWVRLRGYWSFWKTMVMLIPVSLIRLGVQLWKISGGG